ncbi:ApeA N-terminal domain 1-containing protein [Streptomyces chryseus]|uniref:ApeA N-terminal domain 1-containing protein n=1 Tax=Streptomyces chryseus TaxID=68186 RepID=UPI00110F785F|nr:HEPN domain-containing protein [Streptomyces chryseus]GGX29700.1 hypothetical protein GCM10010353_51250 [Streptomyces chryseus]
MANQKLRTTYVGEWWLPDQTDHVMHGTLTIGPRYPELELYDRSATYKKPPSVPVIHGRSAGGISLTLVRNVQTVALTESGAGLAATRLVQRKFTVGTVLVGGSHLREDEVRFNRASLRLTYLDPWVNRSPYVQETGPPESLQVLDDLPIMEASVPGCQIHLVRTWDSHFNRLTDAGFSSHELIELQFDEPVPLDKIEYQFIRPLEQLLHLAAGYPSKALDLQLRNDSGHALTWEVARRGVYSVQRRTPEPTENPVVRPRMRFGMNSNGYPPDIDFEDLVPRWFKLQKNLSDVCDLIFSARSETGGYLQQQLFTIVSALEGLHRGLHPELEKKTAADGARNAAILAAVQEGCEEHHGWLRDLLGTAHRKSYAFRIQELLRETGDVMDSIVGDQDKWVRKLRDVRNDLGHVLSPTTTVDQMVALFSSALLLAEAVLLRRLGFSEAECGRSLDYDWEREITRSRMMKGFPNWFPDSEQPRP